MRESVLAITQVASVATIFFDTQETPMYKSEIVDRDQACSSRKGQLLPLLVVLPARYSVGIKIQPASYDRCIRSTRACRSRDKLAVWVEPYVAAVLFAVITAGGIQPILRAVDETVRNVDPIESQHRVLIVGHPQMMPFEPLMEAFIIHRLHVAEMLPPRSPNVREPKIPVR